MADTLDLVKFVAFGLVAVRLSIGLDGLWWIDDKGFCRYRQIVALMLVDGDRPWKSIQIVVGPVMLSVTHSRGGLAPEDYRTDASPDAH